MPFEACWERGKGMETREGRQLLETRLVHRERERDRPGKTRETNKDKWGGAKMAWRLLLPKPVLENIMGQLP